MSDSGSDRPAGSGGALRLGRIVVMVLLAGFIALLAWGLSTRPADDTIDTSLAAGRAAKAPDFELPVLQPGDETLLASDTRRAVSDGTLSLRELRGHAVVLNFWASWCPPCRKEAPLLERGWRGRPRGVVYLGLDMQDVDTDAEDFLREFDISYPIVREGEDTVARRYGLTGLPETYFIAPNGRVVAHVIGALSDQQLEDGMRALRSARPLAAREGGGRRPTR